MSLEPPQSLFQQPFQPMDVPIQVWPQGWRGMMPPSGLEPPHARGRMRTPSPQPHVGHFPMGGISGRSVEVPVIANDGAWLGRRNPDEAKANFPHGFANARGLSPGPHQVPFQQPHLQSARSTSPRSFAGGPQSMQATPRPATPPLAGTPRQKHVSMPSGLLARIDGVVSEMERELREADQDAPSHDRASVKPEGQPTVDWLNKQIQMLQEQRQVESNSASSKQLPAVVNDGIIDSSIDDVSHERLSLLEKEHIALKRRLEEELRAVRGSGKTPETNSRQSVVANAEPCSRRGSVVAPARLSSSRSLPGIDEPRGSFGVPERTSQPSVPAIEDFRSARGSIVRSSIDSQISGMANELTSARSSQFFSARPSQVALDSQLWESQLCETQAALEREQRVSEEAVQLHQAAEANLRTLENKSQNVLQDCRTLQVKVLQLETEREAALRRIEQLEEDLRVEPVSNLSAERLQVIDLENKLSAEAVRVTEAEMELADVKAERDNYQHHAKTASARVAELEGQLGQTLAVQERKDGEFKMHLDRIQDLEDLVATHQKEDAEYQRQVFELERQLSDLKSNESRRLLEIEQCRSEIKSFEDQHRSLQDDHSRAMATHRSQLAVCEQQAADAEATGSASVRQYKQRVQDLEQELYSMQASKENHSNTNYAHKAAINDLKQQIEHLHTDKERQTKQENQQRARVVELEQQLDTLQGEQSAEKRQHIAAKQRISELAQQLEDNEFAKESLSRQIQAQKQRVTTLEQELEHLQSTDTDHHRQHHHHKTKISELEDQVQQMMSGEEDHRQQHRTNKQRIDELEEELTASKDGHRSYSEQVQSHLRQIAEMNEHLSHARAMAEEASVHRERAMDLDVELSSLKIQVEEAKAADAQNIGEIRRLEKYVEVARAAEASSAGLAEQVARLENEIDKERKHVYRLEIELQDEKGQLEKARYGLELAKRSLEEGDSLKKSTIELDRHSKLQLEKENEKYKLKIDELNVQLQMERNKTNEIRSQALNSSLIPSVQFTPPSNFGSTFPEDLTNVKSQAPTSSIPESASENTEVPRSKMHSGLLTLSREDVRKNHRQDSSVAGASDTTRLSSSTTRLSQMPIDKKRSLAPSKIRSLKRSGTFMPESKDPLVMKLRGIDIGLRECLEECYELHATAIEDQLEKMLEAYEKGKEFREGLTQVNVQLESERQAAAIRVQAFQQELLELRDEFQDNLRLSGDVTVQKATGERVKLDMDKCEEELNLLKSSSPLLGVPEGTLQAMLEVFQNQIEGIPISVENWPDGFSPMHWAAQNNRRDIINYILVVDGGEFLLNARDKHGHPPLYYAHGERRPALAQFLMDSGANAPMHTHEARPDISMLPSTYQKVLQHIESHGWLSMNWKDGFTMLHWAAEKGLGDLCRYLISMDADPSMHDNKYRTPADCAREADKRDVARLLQEIADKPQTEFDLQAFSKHHTASFQPRESLSKLSSGASIDEDVQSDESVKSNEGIPEPYVQVLEQIDRVGWDKMVWARGYTLLHWAGKNDRPDLCSYFLFNKADPNHRDENGKSAIDYAREANSSKALNVLRSAPPDREPPLAHFLISKKGRDSRMVEGHLRKSVEHLGAPSEAFIPLSFFGATGSDDSA